MRLTGGGSVSLRAPERGEAWAADLGVIAAEGERPSAAVYLTEDECRRLAQWLNDMVSTTRASEDEAA